MEMLKKKNILWCLHIPFRESVQWSLRPCNGRLSKRNSWPHLSMSYKRYQFISSASSSPVQISEEMVIATQCSAAVSSQPGWSKLSSPCTMSFILLRTEERQQKVLGLPESPQNVRGGTCTHSTRPRPRKPLDCRAAGPSLAAVTRFQFNRKRTSR